VKLLTVKFVITDIYFYRLNQHDQLIVGLINLYSSDFLIYMHNEFSIHLSVQCLSVT